MVENFTGAWSVCAKKGQSAERWATVERGAVKSNYPGAWSGHAKTGLSVERWRPPNGPLCSTIRSGPNGLGTAQGQLGSVSVS